MEEKLPPVPDWTNLVFREVMQRIVDKFEGAASMRDVFACFDRDQTEYITLEEFEDALKSLGFDGCVLLFRYKGDDDNVYACAERARRR